MLPFPFKIISQESHNASLPELVTISRLDIREGFFGYKKKKGDIGGN